MKKVIICLLMIFCILNCYYVFAKDNTIFGDVDNNGKVETKDYVLVRKMILSLTEKTNAADINNDGSIDAKDYIIIRKIILGIYSQPTSTSSTKKNDAITITLKTATYTGSGISATASSASGSNVSLTYYSDANCKTKTTTSNAISAGGAPKIVGTYYAIGSTSGNNSYNASTSNCTKAVQINHIVITIDKTIIKVTEGKTSTITASPSNVKVTYSSNNPKVATVTSSGVVTGNMAGSVKIIAKSPSGYQKEASIIVLTSKPAKDTISYSSDTLKYWIQFFNVSASGGRVKKYTLTNIWMKNPYNQMKVAHPLKYITPEKIMNNEISTYGYQNKGILAMNASPSSANGYPSIPLVIDTGKDGKTKVLLNTGKTSQYSIYGLGSDGILRTYASNSSTKDKALADGVKYTFGFKPVLVNNYKYDSASIEKAISEKMSDAPNVRSAVCQVDKNNFILITSWGFSIEPGNRLKYGLKMSEVGKMMADLKCITGVNLDGGSSLTYMYKKNSSTWTYLRKSAKEGRSDVLYFAEE